MSRSVRYTTNRTTHRRPTLEHVCTTTRPPTHPTRPASPARRTRTRTRPKEQQEHAGTRTLPIHPSSQGAHPHLHSPQTTTDMLIHVHHPPTRPASPARRTRRHERAWPCWDRSAGTAGLGERRAEGMSQLVNWTCKTGTNRSVLLTESCWCSQQLTVRCGNETSAGGGAEGPPAPPPRDKRSGRIPQPIRTLADWSVTGIMTVTALQAPQPPYRFA